jgi:chemotaxis protein histidine kinase CheA
LGALGKIAKGFGKPLPILVVDDDQYFLEDAARELLDSVLMHLFRNSLDHGIEFPEERILRGKKPEGSIFLSLKESVDEVMIIYQDDGRGLQLEKIRGKALNMGLLRNGNGSAPHDIADLVFSPGFSTAERVTEISGRGVGMDAVRMAIEKFGGRISIVLDEHQHPPLPAFVSFSFVIHLPKNREQTRLISIA